MRPPKWFPLRPFGLWRKSTRNSSRPPPARRPAAGACEHDAAAEVVSAAAFRALAEKHLHLLEPAAGETPARELGAHAVLAAGSACKIDELVFLVLRVQNHVMQAAL